jgi:hypothetical protein
VPGVAGLVLCAAAGFITPWGQRVAHWSGDCAAVREGNPVAGWFLAVHPLAFAAALSVPAWK